MAYRVCLMGASFETGNMGVSALAASFVKNILDLKPDAEIFFLIGNRTPKRFDVVSGGRKITIEIVNQRISPRARLREHIIWIALCAVICRIVPFEWIRQRIAVRIPWLRVLDKANVVCNIHGGDSFSDLYGMRRFMVQVAEDMIALLMKKNLVLLPQTYGPYKHPLAIFIASRIMNKAYRIYSRDAEGIDLVTRILGQKQKQIAFCPDIAFTLEAVALHHYDVEPPLQLPSAVPLVGINVNGLMYNGGYTENNMFGLKCDYRDFLRNLVRRFVNETDARFVIVPHTFGSDENVDSDPASCRKLLGALSSVERERCHIITRSYNQSEIKGIIGKCDFFIGSRMHACIAALSQGVPSVGMAYSKKFAGVFESVGAGDMIVDGRQVDAETAVEKVLYCFKRRADMKLILDAKVAIAQNRIQGTFVEMTSV